MNGYNDPTWHDENDDIAGSIIREHILAQIGIILPDVPPNLRDLFISLVKGQSCPRDHLAVDRDDLSADPQIVHAPPVVVKATGGAGRSLRDQRI